MSSILFDNITIITMEDSCRVIENGFVSTRGSRIDYVGQKRPQGDFDVIIDGRNKVLMPGLINTHSHLAMTLLRGYADDMNLQDWLYNKIFPFEDKLTAGDITEGSRIGIDEMLAGGTTCFSDMYFFQAETGRVAADKGIRAVLSDCVNFDGYDKKVRLMEQMAEEFKSNDLIRFTFSPHAIYTCSFELLKKCGEYAKNHNMPIHTHLAETQKEFDDCMAEHGMTPTEYMESTGIFENPAIAAHCVVMTENDIEILKRHNVSVAHNPMSNLKLASGVAPVPEMLKAGINVALGTDGASSNNSLDMFEEMKAAALVHKGVTRNPTVMDAFTVLKMATISGAKALGYDDLGALKSGWLADMIVLDFDKPHLKPLHNVMSSVVYSAKCSDVEYTVVNGKIVYKR
ncbi:MAG TPA: amidohydrolase [Candidatus Monoglobus merdigallinarum]|uniref:5-methylthioadenosine/S-adenosylhomocysteine deaminase n=1 Tax=Candidatus Monoglobus merdigallinarum TaxID=2838698 RepID=A0A9D1TLI1_9FIRM|nr:amidohydrolase [Candidatus Monoglobus merdigallinarum]